MSKSQTPPRRKGRRWQTTLGLFIVLLGGVAAIGTWLWKAEPAHWRNREVMRRISRVEDRQEAAQRLEDRLSVLMRPKTEPSGEPDVRILTASYREINAWLETELTTWLKKNKQNLPDQIQNPMVATAGRRLIIAFRFDTPELSPIVSLSFNVRTLGNPDQPQLEVKLGRVHAGRIPVPVRAVTKHLRKHESRPKVRALFEQIVAAYDGSIFDPITLVPNQKRHVVRLLEFSLGDDTIQVAVQIEPRP